MDRSSILAVVASLGMPLFLGAGCSGDTAGPVVTGSDTAPPTVSMTAPSTGQTLSGTITVSADASDNVGVVGVQFTIDGLDVGAEDLHAPYSISFDTTSLTNGSHSFSAKARDAAGNTGTATPVSATVDNSSPPTDRFGVAKLYPTVASGREWTLPDNADQIDPTDEWHPVLGTVSAPTPGEFHVSAKPSTGETRLEVRSPSGKRWWKNIEATYYVKRGVDSGPSLQDWWDRHWTIIARGERHQDNTTTKIGANGINTINGQGTPPPDTQAVWPTWPWYPNITDDFVVAEPVLATSYDVNLYPGSATDGCSGRILFEKEITHVNGYADNPPNQGSVIPAGWPVGTPDWVGLKMVVRNYLSDSNKVHLEAWVDRDANGSWVLQTHYDDVPGWAATELDANAGSAPYNYPLDMVITWAGPYVTYRADLMDFEMKWNSIREIDPLP
jgi:hypothetical protein